MKKILFAILCVMIFPTMANAHTQPPKFYKMGVLGCELYAVHGKYNWLYVATDQSIVASHKSPEERTFEPDCSFCKNIKMVKESTSLPVKSKAELRVGLPVEELLSCQKSLDD